MADIALIRFVGETRAFLDRQRRRNGHFNELVRLILKRRKRRRDFIPLLLAEFRQERRFWLEPGRRLSLFWERTVSNWTGEEYDRLWVQNFRMSRSTFDFICEHLNVSLAKEDTKLRKSIPVCKRVAICIWHLATGEDLRSLSWRFDIGTSTACVIVNEVCQAIVDVLLPIFIKWPIGERLQEVLEGFESKWNFPQCAGAIDGTHIPIVPPCENSTDYYNRKCFYSVIMQAVVDHAYRFTDIYIKWPGKVHDARVFKNSSIFAKGQSGDLFPDITKEISSVNVPVMLIGDPAYPLLPWLLKRFPESGHLTPEQTKFNKCLSRARMVVEGAFGSLKGRFRCLLKRNDTSLKYLPTKIAACCVLHNLCQLRSEEFLDDWLNGMVMEVDRDDDTESEVQGGVREVRNALVDYFSSR